MRRLIFCIIYIWASIWPVFSMAEDRRVRVHAPAVLVDSGLIRHIVPRFALKMGVRVELVPDAAQADLRLGSEGRALFSGLGETWHMQVMAEGHPAADKLSGWLTSDVGQRTILGFAPEGTPLFSEPEVEAVEAVALEMTGDAILGKEVSRLHCGRCHTTEAGRNMGIGSTPSFQVLRSMGDWQERFEAFYILKPHGAFTQIDEITEPFPEDRPSPIAPIELTLDDVEAILAYVAVLDAADLGAPLKHQ